MHAVVDIAGKQFKLTQGNIIYVPKTLGKVGQFIIFKNILLLLEGGDLKIGFPFLENIKVFGKILTNVKSKKIIVFKKKRRKGYKKTQGYRQEYTKILINSIKINSKKN
jgi:large subunit ribosomal protein L21